MPISLDLFKGQLMFCISGQNKTACKTTARLFSLYKRADT